MEELLLGPYLAGQELDIVDQQNIGTAVRLLEAFDTAAAEGVEEMVGERLRGRIPDGCVGAKGLEVVADGVQKVGFP